MPLQSTLMSSDSQPTIPTPSAPNAATTTPPAPTPTTNTTTPPTHPAALLRRQLTTLIAIDALIIKTAEKLATETTTLEFYRSHKDEFIASRINEHASQHDATQQAMTALEMATEEIDGLFTRMERNLGAMREQVDGCKALREGVLRDMDIVMEATAPNVE